MARRVKNAKPGKESAKAQLKAQLFDMIADPGQKTNVAAEHPNVAAKLQAAYEAWWADVSKGLQGMPPPLPVGHEQMPAVTLLAPEAEMSGKVHFHQGNGWANDWLSNWSDPADRIWWDIDVVAAGKYRAELLYCCPQADIGATIRIEAAGRSTEAAVTKAHDPAVVTSPDRVKRKEIYEKTWAALEVGVLDLPAGQTRLTVSASTIPGRQAMELKAARLTRLGGTDGVGVNR